MAAFVAMFNIGSRIVALDAINGSHMQTSSRPCGLMTDERHVKTKANIFGTVEGHTILSAHIV